MDGEYHLRNCLQAMAAVQGSRPGKAMGDDQLVGWRRARRAWHQAVELGAGTGACEEQVVLV